MGGKGKKYVAGSHTVIISSVRKSKLKHSTIEYFIDSHEIVIVIELLDGWEVSVRLAVFEWFVKIRVSLKQKLGDLALQNASEDASGQLAQLGRPFLSQLDYCKDIAIFYFG